jgi:protein SCO1/2
MNKKRFQLWLMFFVTFPIISIAVLAATGSFHEKQLKIYGEVPDFTLMERHGGELSKTALTQKVWVANFIFTHCSGQCPGIMQQTKKVQKALRFKENFRLVSITVDPERDTRKVLSDYADQFEADPFKWLFLTAKSEKEVQNLLQKGFHLSATDEGGEKGDDVIHSSKLVLVDGFGRIRGYYDANEDSEVNQIIKDAKLLIKKTF